MARVRIHQHVNPLAKYFRELDVEPLSPSKAFDNPEQPVHIDLGCGRGRFLRKMASEFRDTNFLGIEIREPLVIEANEIARQEGIGNLHYSFCNAPLNLGRLLENIPPEKLELISIQFPDPWFKKRHAKRRMVNSELVDMIDNALSESGRVFVQTDVADLFEEIGERFDEAGFDSEQIEETLFPIKTERELSVEKRGLPVYRSVYSR